MCGFAGFIEFGQRARDVGERHAILERMGSLLEHRGPDDQRIYDDGCLAFVFRRLSVVDVRGGSQPIESEDGSVVVAVNGEIYNHLQLRARLHGTHRFTTSSDCEIAVHLYEEAGIDLLGELNGMFALLVWDKRRRSLLLARDRLGIKPLYWARLRNGLLFGSELKALLAHPDCPRRLRWQDVDWSYLGGDTYTSPNWVRIPTFVEGVESLPGGCQLEIGDSAVPKVRAYWSLADSIADSRESAPRKRGEYVAGYADLLEDSIRMQLMSDVPVGTFLSGGLDSSAIVAIANHDAMHCFSIDQPTTEATGDLARARDLAEDMDLRFAAPQFHHGSLAEQLGFSLDTFEYFIWMMDAPRFAPEAFFKHELHRYVKTIVPELKVIFLGQGADEFAGGYSTSFSSPRADWAEYLRSELAPHHRSLSAKRRDVPPVTHAPSLENKAIDDMSLFHREMLARLWVLQSHNLWNEDRVSSSQGVEARVPFLDHRLVEYLAAIPEQLHASLFFNKAIVREAVAGWLPERYSTAPKVLFWQAEDTSSVHRLMYECLDRIYPDFRDEYRDHVFATKQLDALRASAVPGRPEWTRSSRILLGCMATCVFDRLCAQPARRTPTPVRSPSPLAERSS